MAVTGVELAGLGFQADGVKCAGPSRAHRTKCSTHDLRHCSRVRLPLHPVFTEHAQNVLGILVPTLYNPQQARPHVTQLGADSGAAPVR